MPEEPFFLAGHELIWNYSILIIIPLSASEPFEISNHNPASAFLPPKLLMENEFSCKFPT